VYVYIKTNGMRMTARVNPRSGARPGGKITLHVRREKLHLFDKETEEAYTLAHQA
jgi:multiple sugar transport system ATP-binding protein